MTSDPLFPIADDVPALADIDSGTITLTGSTLTMAGEVDTMLIGAWRVEHPQPPAVSEVDLAAVTFLNSAGAAYLIRLAKSASPARLILLGSSPVAARVLQIMGVHALFDHRT